VTVNGEPAAVRMEGSRLVLEEDVSGTAVIVIK
jgi:hypothetical protein